MSQNTKLLRTRCDSQAKSALKSAGDMPRTVRTATGELTTPPVGWGEGCSSYYHPCLSISGLSAPRFSALGSAASSLSRIMQWMEGRM